MSDLLKQIHNALKRKPGKKKARRKASKKRRASKRKPKIVFRTRTRTVVKYRRVAAKRPHARRKTSKKRRTKKGGKPSKAEFLRRMALGRARAKRARKR
jgi:hypothetical protein